MSLILNEESYAQEYPDFVHSIIDSGEAYLVRSAGIFTYDVTEKVDAALSQTEDYKSLGYTSVLQYLASQLECNIRDLGLLVVTPVIPKYANDSEKINVHSYKAKIVMLDYQKQYIYIAYNMAYQEPELPTVYINPLQVPEESTAIRDDLKYDSDKCRLDLVEPSLIEAVGWIRTFGIKKYPEVYGYKKLAPWRIMGALLRHINAYRKGEKRDPESGYSHLWHAACNIMFLIELERESEDTPNPNKSLRTVE